MSEEQNQKKIITFLEFFLFADSFYCSIDHKEIQVTFIPESLKILKNCSIKEMELKDSSLFSEKNVLWTREFEKLFYEASKFVIKSCINLPKKIVQRLITFFQKLNHLNILIVGHDFCNRVANRLFFTV